MNDERFKNRKEALSWLQSRGQISTGKFYQDCADGKVTIYPDKTLSRYQVMEYAEKAFGFTRQNQSSVDLADKKERLAIEEQELKIAKLKREQETAERELSRDWQHREEFDGNLAGLLHMFVEACDHHLYQGSADLIQICGGDAGRIDEVYAASRSFISAAVSEVLDHGRIEGVFETFEIEDDEP